MLNNCNEKKRTEDFQCRWVSLTSIECLKSSKQTTQLSMGHFNNASKLDQKQILMNEDNNDILNTY